MKPLRGDLTHSQVQQVSPCSYLYLLVTQQRLTPIAASLFDWQLFKQLIVACQETNVAGKVDAYAFVPLLCKLITYVNASQPFNMECHEVS